MTAPGGRGSIRRLEIRRLWSRDLRERSAEGTEVFPIAPGAFFWCAHARQDVLLDKHVAVVAALAEAVQECGEIDAAIA